MFDRLQLTVRCDGIPPNELVAAANGVEFDFRKHRPWHQKARCWPDERSLLLSVHNDFDEDGSVVCEDFRSALRELVSEFGPISVVAIEPMPDPPNGARLPVPALASRRDGLRLRARTSSAIESSPGVQRPWEEIGLAA
jgi:hypothetical protein